MGSGEERQEAFVWSSAARCAAATPAKPRGGPETQSMAHGSAGGYGGKKKNSKGGGNSCTPPEPAGEPTEGRSGGEGKGRPRPAGSQASASVSTPIHTLPHIPPHKSPHSTHTPDTAGIGKPMLTGFGTPTLTVAPLGRLNPKRRTGTHEACTPIRPLPPLTQKLEMKWLTNSASLRRPLESESTMEKTSKAPARSIGTARMASAVTNSSLSRNPDPSVSSRRNAARARAFLPATSP